MLGTSARTDVLTGYPDCLELQLTSAITIFAKHMETILRHCQDCVSCPDRLLPSLWLTALFAACKINYLADVADRRGIPRLFPLTYSDSIGPSHNALGKAAASARISPNLGVSGAFMHAHTTYYCMVLPNNNLGFSSTIIDKSSIFGLES
jgi:hypothetical protein